MLPCRTRDLMHMAKTSRGTMSRKLQQATSVVRWLLVLLLHPPTMLQGNVMTVRCRRNWLVYCRRVRI